MVSLHTFALVQVHSDGIIEVYGHYKNINKAQEVSKSIKDANSDVELNLQILVLSKAH